MKTNALPDPGLYVPDRAPALPRVPRVPVRHSIITLLALKSELERMAGLSLKALMRGDMPECARMMITDGEFLIDAILWLKADRR